jgi:4-hydroxybenzoate polyprenyltransferase
MWQRIQTLYMALAAVSLFAVGAANPTEWSSLLAGLGVALFTANTTYFRYRQRQFVVNRIGILAAFALEVVYVIPVLNGTAGAENSWSLALPLVAVVFASMANRAIQADEAKVREADRFRPKKKK